MSLMTVSAPEVSMTQQVMELERHYLLQNYSRYPLVLVRGKGCWLWDADGKRYLDLIAGIGVNALGHRHPRIMRAIREQSARMIHISNLYYHEFQGKLAEKLARISGLQRAFFCNSGAESMEAALKIVRAHGRRLSAEKIEILALENSFHGRTLGALSITGQQKYRRDFEPLLPGVRFLPFNDVGALEQAIGPQTAGLVLEGIQGEGGIHPVWREYAARARQLCDRHNALLVFDEIQCGVGRPGVYFWYQLEEPVVLPDVIAAAKPLGCGLPIGVVVSNEKAAQAIAPGMHGTTFGGNPLACRVALEFLEVLDELLPSIRNVGAYFKLRLSELAHKHAVVKEIRGAGLMLGMELERPCKQLVLDAMAEGLLINCTHETVLRFLPPYIIGEHEVDRAVRILDKILRRWKAAEEQG
jgi:predicted acetylornithine/succinylornithine family transaminase